MRVARLLLGLQVVLMCLPCFGESPSIAILYSQYARTYFRLHYPDCSSSFYLGADEFDRYYEGWTYVLGSTQFARLTDADITETGLANYGLLILPNAVSLSDDQTRAIQNWVIRGGRLLATFGSGYKDIISDPRQADGLKLQEGGTTGLHNLWHDPMSKVVTTQAINPTVPGVDIGITRFEGPTAGLEASLSQGVLGYGALANVLIQRPPDFKDAYGFLIINNTVSRLPAILASKFGKGLVVYYAFAPEYLVALEFRTDLRCSGDTQNWSGRSTDGMALMKATIAYLLGTN